MLGVVAAILFVGAAALAIITMALMFRSYRDKMIAALLFRPAAEVEQPRAHIVVTRRRTRPAPQVRRAPARTALAA